METTESETRESWYVHPYAGGDKYLVGKEIAGETGKKLGKLVATFASADEAALGAAAPDMLAALERAKLSTGQIRLAANIGKKSMPQKIAWYEGQLDQLADELRDAIRKARGES